MSDCPSLEQLESFLLSEDDQHLASHLDQCASCQHHLEELRENQGMFERLQNRAPPDATPAGAPSLEGYVIESVLHHGGQGVVYKARQLTTHRTVAIKVLLDGVFASPARRKRFDREIELVSSLRHPNIVTVHDSGATADGQHYLVMEYVRGVPLHRYLETGPGTETDDHHSLAKLLQLFASICDAVNFAHQRGVIHRDLKPGNILVDTAGEPRIIDFGLAKVALDDHGEGVGPLTTSGEFMGTLAFASPEQLGADPELVDLRTDVYSLGVVLYHLLTGQSPYPAHSSVRELVRAISDTDPRAPSSLHLESAHPTSGNADLDAITLRALAKERDRRYQSAGELARDIRNHLAGRPVDARRDSTLYVLRKLLARYRPLVLLAAALLVVIVGATIVSIRGWQDANVQTRRAQRETEKANEYGSFLSDLFASVDPDSSQGEDVTVRELLDATATRLDTHPPEEPAVEMAIRVLIGDGYRRLGFRASAKPHYVRALALADRIPDADPEEHLMALLMLAEALREQGGLEEARSHLQAAEDLIEARGGGFPGQTAIIARSRAAIAMADGRSDDASILAREAEEQVIRTFGAQSDELVSHLVTHGELLVRHGQDADGMRLLERARQILIDTDRTQSVRYSGVLRHLADGALRRGEARQAHGLRLQAYELLVHLLSSDHPVTLFTASQVALAARRLGLPMDPAIPKSLDDARLHLRPAASEWVAHLWNNLALLSEMDGDLAEAETCLRHSLESLDSLPGSNRRRRAVIQANLSWALFRQGFRQEAERNGEEAYEDLRATRGSVIERVIHVSNLVWMLVQAGNLDRAAQVAQDTLALAQLELPDGHPHLGESLSTMGLVRHGQGDCEVAEDLLRQACNILDPDQVGPTPACLYAHHRLAVCLQGTDQVDEADERYLALAKLYQQSGEVAAWEHPQVLLDLGRMRLEQEWFEEAREVLREAVEHAQSKGPDAAAQFIGALNSTAEVELLLDEPDVAQRHLRKAVLQGRLLLTPGHQERQRSLRDLRDLLEEGEDREQVLPVQEELHSCLRRARGDQDPATRREARRLLSLYEELGREEDAARLRNSIQTP